MVEFLTILVGRKPTTAEVYGFVKYWPILARAYGFPADRPPTREEWATLLPDEQADFASRFFRDVLSKIREEEFFQVMRDKGILTAESSPKFQDYLARKRLDLEQFYGPELLAKPDLWPEIVTKHLPMKEPRWEIEVKTQAQLANAFEDRVKAYLAVNGISLDPAVEKALLDNLTPIYVGQKYSLPSTTDLDAFISSRLPDGIIAAQNYIQAQQVRTRTMPQLEGEIRDLVRKQLARVGATLDPAVQKVLEDTLAEQGARFKVQRPETVLDDFVTTFLPQAVDTASQAVKQRAVFAQKTKENIAWQQKQQDDAEHLKKVGEALLEAGLTEQGLRAIGAPPTPVGPAGEITEETRAALPGAIANAEERIRQLRVIPSALETPEGEKALADAQHQLDKLRQQEVLGAVPSVAGAVPVRTAEEATAVPASRAIILPGMENVGRVREAVLGQVKDAGFADYLRGRFPSLEEEFRAEHGPIVSPGTISGPFRYTTGELVPAETAVQMARALTTPRSTVPFSEYISGRLPGIQEEYAAIARKQAEAERATQARTAEAERQQQDQERRVAIQQRSMERATAAKLRQVVVPGFRAR